MFRLLRDRGKAGSQITLRHGRKSLSAAGSGDGLPHIRISLHIAELVIVSDSQPAAAERIGHRLRHFRLGFHKLGPTFFNAGILLLLHGDGCCAASFGPGAGHAGIGLGLISPQASADIFTHVNIGNVDGDNFKRRVGIELPGQNFRRDLVGGHERVAQVRLLTPDKDLAQCVRGRRVIQVDRRSGAEIDEEAVREKYGIGPVSIPDYLALVGDTSDGFPGLQGWGAKSAAAVLGRYRHVEAIPDEPERWAADGIAVRGAAKLAMTLRDGRETAALFKRLATLVDTVEVGTVDDWRWRGPTAAFASVARDLGAEGVAERAARLAEEPETGVGPAG